MGKIRKVLYQGLVHGVNRPPVPTTLYCLQDWPKADWAEWDPSEEPISCMACLAKGPGVSTINGIETVLHHLDLPLTALDGTLRYVWGERADFRLWKYDRGEWRMVLGTEEPYLQKILRAGIKDIGKP